MSVPVRTQTRHTTTPGDPVPDQDWIIDTDTNPGGLPVPNLDVNGVKMLVPSNPNGPSHFYKVGDSLTTGAASGKYIYTDDNYSPTVKTEGALTFVRLTSGPVTYGGGTTGKTMRLNLNAGGFIPTQSHTWQNTTGYIWTPNDSKNVEFTYYFRCMNMLQKHTTCSSKMRGGIHSGSNDPRSSCFETTIFVLGGESSNVESALEYNHPDYVFSVISPLIANQVAAGKWVGRKTVCYTGTDRLVHTIDYVDLNPFDSSGKPLNNWQKFFIQTFSTDTSKFPYNKIANWGGMMTYRQDGFQYVDVPIISVREILPPT